MALKWIHLVQVLFNTNCEVLILQHVVFSVKAYFGVYLTRKELKYISCVQYDGVFLQKQFKNLPSSNFPFAASVDIDVINRTQLGGFCTVPFCRVTQKHISVMTCMLP